jgi:excisionase family DNA binding protein
MPPVEEGWLSLEEAAKACGVAYRTMLAFVRRGEVPADKENGRPYRVRRADVEAFIERSSIRPGELRSVPPSRRRRR